VTSPRSALLLTPLAFPLPSSRHARAEHGRAMASRAEFAAAGAPTPSRVLLAQSSPSRSRAGRAVHAEAIRSPEPSSVTTAAEPPCEAAKLSDATASSATSRPPSKPSPSSEPREPGGPPAPLLRSQRRRQRHRRLQQPPWPHVRVVTPLWAAPGRAAPLLGCARGPGWPRRSQLPPAPPHWPAE
jgi:hypothetical protein